MCEMIWEEKIDRVRKRDNMYLSLFFFSSRRRHTRFTSDWSSDVCSSDLNIDIRAGLISFNIPDIHPHDLGTFLDSKGIAIRTGHHCAMPLIKKLGSHSSARASFYIYNTNQEIDKFTTEINNSIKYFNNV